MESDGRVAWAPIIAGVEPPIKVVSKYLYGQLDFRDLALYGQKASSYEEFATKILIDSFRHTTINELIELVRENPKETLTKSNFIWFYNLDDCIFSDLTLLQKTPLSNEEIGLLSPHCTRKSKSNTQRFGQAHSSMLEALGLVYHIDKKNILSPLGNYCLKLTLGERMEIMTKLFFRLPVIRYIYQSDNPGIEVLAPYARTVVTESTWVRRSSSINSLISEIKYQLAKEFCRDYWDNNTARSPDQ